MNDRQLAGFIRQAFALEKYGNDAVKQANPALADAIAKVQDIIRMRLPDESLLRDQAVRQLMPEVGEALRPYNRAFAESLVGQLVGNTEEIQENAVEMVERAGISIEQPGFNTGPVAPNVQEALNTRVNNLTIRRLFNVDGDSPLSEWTRQNMRSIEQNVRTGIINGLPTPEIAKQIAGPGAERLIRGQALAVARTAVHDFNHQVNQAVWDANADVIGDLLVYEWVSALDSRVCATCGPLDGTKKKDRGDFPVSVPAHVNCRCRMVLVDPDEDDDVRTGIELRPTKPTGPGAYKTKVKVKGKKFYRATVQIKGEGATYADYLAGTNELTQAQYFGGGQKGADRANWFRQAVRKGKEPKAALMQLVTKPEAGIRGFKFDLPDLALQEPTKVKPKRKPRKKAVPKPKAKTPPPPPPPKPKSLSPEEKALAKAKAFAEKEKARAKARKAIESAKTDLGIDDDELERALALAKKPLVRQEEVYGRTGIDPVKLFNDNVENKLGSGAFGTAV